MDITTHGIWLSVYKYFSANGDDIVVTVQANALRYADAAIVLFLLWAVVFFGLSCWACCGKLHQVIHLGQEVVRHAILATVLTVVIGVIVFSIIRWS